MVNDAHTEMGGEERPPPDAAHGTMPTDLHYT
jgi:hypothetical protein